MHQQIEHHQSHIHNPLAHQFSSSYQPTQQNKRIISTHQKSLSHFVKETREIQQCTFSPKVNQDGQAKRSLSRFLKDQDKFLLSKRQKINQLRNQINKTVEHQISGQPQIDNKSNKMATYFNSFTKSTNIFERLSKQKHFKAKDNEEAMFSPKILNKSKSMIRHQNISTLLYEDAKRRQQKDQFIEESSTKKKQLSPHINSNTNILVGKLICSEFTDLVTDEDMSPIVAISVLSEIFNVDLNPNKNAYNSVLAHKILKYICQSSHQSVRSERLWLFIQTILHKHIQNNCFSEKQESQIYSEFHYFYYERLSKERKSITPEKLTFRPKTLASSSKLAESYREKACQDLNNFIESQQVKVKLNDGNLTLEDLFILDHQKKLFQNEQKKRQKQNNEVQNCTFKPNLTHSSISIKNIQKKPKIVIKLTQKAKDQAQKTNAKKDVNQQIQKSKASKNIAKRKETDKQNQMNLSQLSSAKNVDKVVMRMSIGRQKREFSQKLMERGYPKDENWIEYRNEMHRTSIQNSKRLKGYDK